MASNINNYLQLETEESNSEIAHQTNEVRS